MTAEQSQQEPKISKRIKKRVWLALAIALILLIIACVLLRSPNVEKQLAAIEAARAVPHSENAAIIYTRIFEGHDEALLSPPFLDPNTADLTYLEFWSARDHPKLARWLDQLQEPFAGLLEAAKKDK